MNPPQPPSDDSQLRRANVRRTVLVVAGIAVAIYVGFILSGVFGW